MDEPDIDFLLSRGALSGRQREEALEHILDRIAPRKLGGRRGWILAAALAATLGVVLFAVRPKPHATEGTFAARGEPVTEVRVELVCVGGSLIACPHGAHLLFAASGGAQPGYLAAYAEPVGGGERIWYFSSEHDAPAIAAGAGAAAPLDAAIRVGPEHGAGRYWVHILVGAKPLSREQALRAAPGDVLLSETIEVDVVQ